MKTIITRIKRRQEEDAIQAQIFELLRVAAIDELIYFAVPNGGKRDWNTAKTLKDTGVMAGVLDIILIEPARRIPHFMEVKTKRGSLSDDQEDFIARLQHNGLPFAVVRSRDEAQDVLTAWGLLRVKTHLASVA
ncbi:VRR-NUC domain-containing protein [Methylosinus sp. PW1]|uniref:VRR-NUC domain-containing protein n=1 Tax=Methylosinus sp. PW1 TaxID=107636 RepID=UPI00068A4CA8|nr:VRR-NUC domain-containing protein [Methylosinus sp. PW1]